MLDRLAQLDYEDVPVTKTQLKMIFDKLAKLYSDHDLSENLPVQLSLIADIWNRLDQVDDLPESNKFTDSYTDKDATIGDLLSLLERLSWHYASGPGMI